MTHGWVKIREHSLLSYIDVVQSKGFLEVNKENGSKKLKQYMRGSYLEALKLKDKKQLGNRQIRLKLAAGSKDFQVTPRFSLRTPSQPIQLSVY